MSCGYPRYTDRCLICHITGAPLCHVSLDDSDDDIDIDITCSPYNGAEEQIACIPSDIARVEASCFHTQSQSSGETDSTPKKQSAEFVQKPSPTTIVTSAHIFSPIHRPYRVVWNPALAHSPPPRIQSNFDSPPNVVPPSTPQQKCLPAPPTSPLEQAPLPQTPPQPSAHDDIQVEVLRGRERTVLPSTNSLPVKPLHYPQHIPQLGLPPSPQYLLLSDNATVPPPAKRAALREGSIVNGAQPMPTIPPATAVAIRAPPCQQVVQANEAEHQQGEGYNAVNPKSGKATNLKSFDLVFNLSPEWVLKMVTISTAKQWLDIVEHAVEGEGARYVRKARAMRRREREKYPLELKGRIGKLLGAKSEGSKFGNEKEKEVRKVVSRKLVVPYFKLPFEQGEVAVIVPLPKILQYCEVPFAEMPDNPLRFSAVDLAAEDSILVFPSIVANTKEELEHWMEEVQEECVPLFVEERSRTVREVFNSQKPKGSHEGAKKLKNKIDAKVKAVQREDLKSTQRFTLEQLVRFGCSS